MKTSQSDGLESLLQEHEISREIRMLAMAVQSLQEEVQELRHRAEDHEQDTNIHHTHTMGQAHG